MEEQQEEIMEELWEILWELCGDVIALETFCRGGKRSAADFGPSICNAYVQRMGDYIEQHLKDLERLTGHLLQDSRALSQV